ncbi:uncharacterized protein LOC122245856 isoform X2 [Penaeus japonicus]|uniref:uncharacterized protein LOC122245856 isoform X2 n=1 Tax=Penaeus japonicus TaxID=27405 RepID=UPI001C716965|nr:uncharacterized protein LOC122245856 isoform X2 [Penaeus japonicus]
MLFQMFGRLHSVVFLVSAVCGGPVERTSWPSANGEPCDVMRIRAAGPEPPMMRVTYSLDLCDPTMCKEGTWTIQVVEVNEKHYYSPVTTRHWNGSLCLPKPGNVKLQVGSVMSEVIEVPDRRVNYSHAFQSFSTEGLELKIREDQRVESWKVDVLNCRKPPEEDQADFLPFGYVLGACSRNSSRSFSKDIHFNASFNKTVCYVFHLEPIGYDKSCELLKDNRYFTSKYGCHPSDTLPPPPLPFEGHGFIWYLVVAGGVILAVPSACLTIILRRRMNHSFSDGIANSGSTTKAKRPPMTVMVLYMREDCDHLARVSTFIHDLKSKLDCKILDIYDDKNTSILEDPHGHILETMSSSSCTKVILLLSSGVTRLQRSLLDNDPATEAPSAVLGGSEKDEHKGRVFLLALKRLHEPDLVCDYARIFVVSLADDETPCKDLDVKLLVDACRYHLPEHWSLLLTALSSTAPC